MIFENYPLPFFHAQNEVKGGRMQEVVQNITLEKLNRFRITRLRYGKTKL